MRRVCSISSCSVSSSQRAPRPSVTTTTTTHRASPLGKSASNTGGKALLLRRTTSPSFSHSSKQSTATSTSTSSSSCGSGRLVRTSLSSRNYAILNYDLNKIRNIGISAHIDSGKTTLTERILYYTGRISEMHEVKGKDGVGATMDSMELERERGITIQSAATTVTWKDFEINIIDTPGHVDFTIEVERALRVLDGAVLVLCSVAGVQSQTITVDRQMRRYDIPRVCFINKCDRAGANPFRAIQQIQEKLGHKCAAVQFPIGLESAHEGIVDLITQKAYYFHGPKGDDIVEEAIPERFAEFAEQKRRILIEELATVDDTIGEKVLIEEKDPSVEEMKQAIRRATLARKFIPVFMGSAVKNKGVQLLLNGVLEYLPNPTEVQNFGHKKVRDQQTLDDGTIDKGEERIELMSDPSKSLVGLAFKLEDGRYGQLTYMRIYQGSLKRSDTIYNVSSGKKMKVPRLVKMHANQMEEIQEAQAGEICAMFGLDCGSGTTFTNGERITMESMYVPEAVMSLSIATSKRDELNNFSKALAKFQKEDPTFRVHVDPESSQTIMSGMGELHLNIYTERMKREYQVDAVVGKPQVAFRETCRARAVFDYTHKKQSGGAGQYAKVQGYIEPVGGEAYTRNEFIDATVGGCIPPEFIPAIEKGFNEACGKGPLINHPLLGVRLVVNNGAWHPVDSSELAFRIATSNGLRKTLKKASAGILEPVMQLEVHAPSEFQGALIGALNRRKGIVSQTDLVGDYVTLLAEVPLNNMFGYSTELRSMTQGKGEFTMEFSKYNFATNEVTNELIDEYKKKRAAEQAAKDTK